MPRLKPEGSELDGSPSGISTCWIVTLRSNNARALVGYELMSLVVIRIALIGNQNRSREC